jgi:CBS domain-containing protein
MIPEKLRTFPVTEFVSPASALGALESTSRVVGVMRESNLYEAFIEEPERTAIVTIRDILKITNISTTKLYSLMYYIPRLNKFNTVGDAASLMFEHRIRSLPIYQGSKLVGQITSKSIVEKLLDSEQGPKASEIMTPKPICSDARDRVSKAREIMIRRRIDQLPILKSDKLYGAITSEGIVSALLPPVDRTMKGDWRRGRFDVPVEDYCSSTVAQNELIDSLQSVLSNMQKAGSNYSIIEDFGAVQGIITYRDILKLLLKPREPEQLPYMYIVGLPDDPFEAEAAREKFQRVIQLLARSFPEMTEARAIIKTGETKAARKKYQVKIFINSPYWHHSYSVFRYELPDAFDYIEDWATKLLSQYRNRRERRRVRSDYGFVQEKERVSVRPIARQMQR